MSKEIILPLTRIRIGRFVFLLLSLLLMFILRPFLEPFVGIKLLMNIFITAILISGVYAVSRKKSVFLIALIIAFFDVIIKWINHFLHLFYLDLLGMILAIFFVGFTAIIILIYIFEEKEITVDVFSGAISVYFLIGFLWAFAYSLLELISPGSFQTSRGLEADLAQFAYFSFVTMTTLGYGDITPIGNPARSLSLLEAVMGQLYLAVLIARLVGIHIAQSLGGADHK